MTDCPIHSAAKTTLGSVALAVPAICTVVPLSGHEVGLDALLDTFIAAGICVPAVFVANYVALVLPARWRRSLPRECQLPASDASLPAPRAVVTATAETTVIERNPRRPRRAL